MDARTSPKPAREMYGLSNRCCNVGNETREFQSASTPRVLTDPDCAGSR